MHAIAIIIISLVDFRHKYNSSYIMIYVLNIIGDVMFKKEYYIILTFISSVDKIGDRRRLLKVVWQF